ncbi:MAG: hypothetical protein H6559_20225 [Lewinellaceae bacterium]|nr:hypothetical protein [Lewinellaceae bacterium]
MGYQSRKRNYKSRREKFSETMRSTRVFLIFLTIGMAVWFFRNRYEFWGWLKTYIY